MKTNKEIAEAALAARDRHEKESKKRRKGALAAAAALALTVSCAAAAAIANRKPFLPSTNAPSGETAGTEASASDLPARDPAEPSAVTEERRYSALTGEAGFAVKTGAGAGDYALFSEAYCLGDAEIIAEITVTDAAVKQYRFKTEYAGKFENAGKTMTILYEPQSFVVTARVEKLWRGPADLKPGDTVVFEDEILNCDGVFGCREGKTYVAALMQGEDVLIEGSGEKLVEGDNTRVTRWRRLCPYQPPVEKTLTGDYIAPDTWESLTRGAERVEISAAEDAPFGERFYADRMRFVPADDFCARMQALADAYK